MPADISFQQAVDAAQSADTRLILQQLGQLERKVDSTLADHETRLRALETKHLQLEGRVTNYQIAQGVYSTVAGVLAAFWRGGA